MYCELVNYFVDVLFLYREFFVAIFILLFLIENYSFRFVILSVLYIFHEILGEVF